MFLTVLGDEYEAWRSSVRNFLRYFLVLGPNILLGSVCTPSFKFVRNDFKHRELFNFMECSFLFRKPALSEVCDLKNLLSFFFISPIVSLTRESRVVNSVTLVT
jgi:hypothetical protein